MKAAASAPLARGQEIELSIEKGVYRGRGLARHEGRVVFVARAHAGDRVRARVSETHAGWAEARVVELIEAGPGRRGAPCPHASQCGGCAYQELAYDAQLALKGSVLRETLSRAGVPLPGDVGVVGSPEIGWRLRASLHFSTSYGRLQLGLRQEGTRRVAELTACQQLSRSMNRSAWALLGLLATRPALHRRLRGLDLLEAPDGSALVALLETTLSVAEAQALTPLLLQTPGLSGFGVACAGRLAWLHGAPHVEASVLGARLRAHVRSFFQANRFLLEPLVRAVTSSVPAGPGRVLDLYAGVGLFALPLAARGESEVLAVELAGNAVEDARANARRAGYGRLRVMEADVREALSAVPSEPGERVVLDPPRTGAGAEVVDLIAARRPTAIVYVSCDPPTLGRDLARFATHGYRADSARLFDLFPTTFHLETVVVLRAV